MKLKKRRKTPLKRFLPGSIIEIDDGQGGRRVVLVRLNGTTYSDRALLPQAQPKMIHPHLNPAGLGLFSDWIKDEGLRGVLDAFIDYANAQGHEAFVQDPLLQAKALWFLAKQEGVREEPQRFIPDVFAMVEDDEAKAARDDELTVQAWRAFPQFRHTGLPAPKRRANQPSLVSSPD